MPRSLIMSVYQMQEESQGVQRGHQHVQQSILLFCLRSCHAECQVLQVETNNAKALFLRAAAYRLKGDYEDAHRDYKKLLVCRPSLCDTLTFRVSEGAHAAN